MDILGVIPARGGSKGFLKKNAQMLSGKPLIAHTIIAAQEASLITRLVVSTEDEEITEVSRRYGTEVIARPVELAADDSPIDDALRHSVTYLREKEAYNPDIVVLMQANLPVRKESMIDTVIRKLTDSGADSAVSIYKVDQRPEWMKRLRKDKLFPRYSLPKGYRRQDLPELYLLDGAVLAIRTEVLFKTAGDRRTHAYLGNDVRGVIQDKCYSIEIDSPEDIILAEAILQTLSK